MKTPMTADRESAVDPERWVDEHGDALYRYAMLRLRDPEQAADLVQETFLEALRTRDAFEGRSTERTWMIAILRHRIVDHLRRQRRRREADEGDETPESIDRRFFDARGKWIQGPQSWGDRPDRALERSEFWDVLEGCLSRLPPTLAGAFFLRELDGLSTDDVCVAIGITPDNLWTRLHRARLLLRDCLERHWFLGGT